MAINAALFVRDRPLPFPHLYTPIEKACAVDSPHIVHSGLRFLRRQMSTTRQYLLALAHRS